MLQNAVVIGSGVMGRGIAYVSAVGGFDVQLVDVKEDQLENAKKEIDSIFQKRYLAGSFRKAMLNERKKDYHTLRIYQQL